MAAQKKKKHLKILVSFEVGKPFLLVSGWLACLDSSFPAEFLLAIPAVATFCDDFSDGRHLQDQDYFDDL